MNSNLSKAEFYNLCGVSRQALYKAIKANHVKVNKKGQVVFDDPLTKLYYETQLAKKSTTSEKITPPGKAPANGETFNLVELQQQKTIEEIGKIKADRRLKELSLSVKRDELIEKETTAAVLFQYLDALNINMLSIPEMIIDTMIDKIKADGSRGDLIELMRKSIQQEIRSTKKQIKERLK